ncbi:MAG: hypothetical protein GWN07_19365, partial [Actinobacteria bacterium]|nr:hypothetical protein [Actinomycetota bacterium]NIS32590.1 hypothetical protein [Actinomycetota bacterium]NIT96342.1 hypothetical protein [Actinomycetota bacterium]NIU67600.1 hypothetical protein [Actinomycetota bacterium]NIW29367.1 hypothetical protein [Actinomycetota bacterium]
RLLSGGPPIDVWARPLPMGLAAIAAVAGTLAAPAPRWRVAGVGGILLAVGLAVGSTPDLGGEAA